MELLTQRYKEKIAGIISCYDRVIITGTLPRLCYAQGMSNYLYEKGIRIFDYTKFAEPFARRLRENAQAIAKANGIEVEYLRKASISKEKRVQEYLLQRGHKPGLVCILSVMETCEKYKPWYNKKSQKSYLIAETGKCLHYYFYFIDEQFGLCYVRVPTWCPFRLQIYFNGHNWLANQLDKAAISYRLLDNAFIEIEDFDKAQTLADEFYSKALHTLLDKFADTYCPIYGDFEQTYHWSILQAEYSLDIVFKKQEDLQPIYDQLVTTAIHTVKPENIATFLGRKLDGKYQAEVGNRYNVRLEGSRIRHSMGNNSIKMYDKFSHILRIETTTNNVSFFKHYRRVEHQDGTSSRKYAAMKKNIYSLGSLKDCLKAANRRYLEFISAIEDRRVGRDKLTKISTSVTENNRSYKGFNFFDEQDLKLLYSILRGEFNISGFQNKHLKSFLPQKSSGQISRLLKRMRTHGLIKRIGKTYKYYLTKLGKHVILTALKIKELVIIPELDYAKTT